MKLNQYLIYLGAMLAFLPFQNCSKSFEFKESSSEVEALAAPTISLREPIAPLSNRRNMAISYIVVSSGAAGSISVTCTMNTAPVNCTSDTLNLTGLADGDYNLRLVARNSRGQESAPLAINFRVDATAPAVVLSQTPSAVSGVATAEFVFASTDALSGVDRTECALDALEFVRCNSPLNLTALSSGRHRLRLRAIDSAGNISNEQMHTWMVDLSAPVLVISQSPGAFTNSRNVSVSFSGTDEGVAITNFECRLDSANFASCSSPVAYSGLADGSHTISIRGRDTAGNMSSPINVNWTVDTVLPTISITQSPMSSTTQTSANFSFTATDASSGVSSQECQLDNQSYQACSMTANFSGLSVGTHVFRVRAVDRAGNQQSSTFNWTVTAPAPAITSIRLAWDPNTEAALAGYRIYYGTSSGIYSQNINAGLPATVSGAVSFFVPGLTAGQRYYFVVRAYDSSGVESLSSNEISAVP